MSSFRSVLLAAFALASLAFGALAHALETKPYSAEALAAAQKAGKPVAVHFHADWCPVCRRQEQALSELKGEKGLDIVVLVANYDTEKDLKAAMKVRSQSTMVVFRGSEEKGRLAGDSSADKIRAVLKSAL